MRVEGFLVEHSSTAGWRERAFSTSAEYTFSPPETVDGRLRSGDAACMDEDGFIFIVAILVGTISVMFTFSVAIRLPISAGSKRSATTCVAAAVWLSIVVGDQGLVRGEARLCIVAHVDGAARLDAGSLRAISMNSWSTMKGAGTLSCSA
jgi:hypothetical protein